MNIWAKILAGLAIVGALMAAGWHYRAVIAERDQLKTTLQAEQGARKQAEKNLASLQKDNEKAVKNEDKLIQDRDMVRGRLDAALSTAGRLHINVPPSAPAPAAGASGPGNSEGRACGLSVEDASNLEQRISRVEAEAYRIAAAADGVALKLGACQAEIVRLQAAPE